MVTGDVHAWANVGDVRRRPTIVEACRGAHIASLAGGYGHTAVVPADGAEPFSTTMPAVRALAGAGALRELAFGKEHVLALTAEGEVLTFGKGGWGQLGHASMSDAPEPRLVRKLADRRVARVAAGALHSLALAESGDVYSWGRGFEGQLGHGDGLDEAVLSPRCIAGLRAAGRVVAISAGSMHSAALGADGRVWAWGDGTSGQLGVGKLLTKAPRPLLVPNLPPCTALSCGYMHTAVAAGVDGAWCWGLGTHGQLGREAAEPNRRFALSPSRVGGALADAHVVAIECAGGSTTALDADGRVHVWGDGDAAPSQIAALAGAGRFGAIASSGKGTLGLVQTSLSHTAPTCAPLAGGSKIRVFGWGFYDRRAPDGVSSIVVRFARAAQTGGAGVDGAGAGGSGGDDGGGGGPTLCSDVPGWIEAPRPNATAADGVSSEQRNALRCVEAIVPALGALEGVVDVSVSFDGGDSFTPAPLALHAVAQPHLVAVDPPLVPVGGGSGGGALLLADAPIFNAAEVVARLTPHAAPRDDAPDGAPGDAADARSRGSANALELLNPADDALSTRAQPRWRRTGDMLLRATYDEPSGGFFIDLSEVPAPLVGSISLALDGVTFTDSSCELTVYAPPVVTRLAPASGPLSGGTVMSVFVETYVRTTTAAVRLSTLVGAREGGAAVNGAPPPPGTTGGAPAAAAEAAAARAPPLAAPAVESAPAGADAGVDDAQLEAGAEPLALTLAARMGEDGERPGGGVLTFTVPPNALGETPAVFAIAVSLNGVDFTPVAPGAARFFAHGELAVSALQPSFGPPTGGTTVRVSGGPFFETSEARAKVHAGASMRVVPAVYERASRALEFVTPPWDAAEHGGVSDPIVEVSLNGADWTIWCTHFTFVQWELLALEPPNALPGAALKLRGANFAAAAGAPAEVRVRFQVTLADGEQIVEKIVGGTYDSADGADGAVLVEAPLFDGLPGAVARVTLALNGVDYAPGARDFKFDEPKGSKKK
ncbi:hypothetical protein KFE25_001223 [Diacronema lutheri]|uniref:RCC1-like domain-containing protein n=2 Tax=Diacronema lutheri TaxID=2081491 RepID=A0A8J6C637_DIALT|nr:hypothetical protein KFE25_001223 [Diacronema lutheri]